MKTKFFSALFFLMVLSASTFASGSLAVPDKVRNSFDISFPEVTNERWQEHKDSYEVSFYERDKSLCRMLFTFDGTLVQTYKYYTENGLPLFIRSKLGKNYAGKDIHGVTEVYSNGETKYHIVLQDDIHLYQVLADQYGNLRLEKKLTISR